MGAGTDIATLGIRIDTAGGIQSTRVMVRELDALGIGGEKVQKKLEHFAQASVFSLGDLAAKGEVSLGSLSHAASGLGFAFGGLTGAVALSVAGIVDAWSDARKGASDEQERMLKDMRSFASKYSQEGLKISIAALESRAGVLFGETQRTAAQEPTPWEAFKHQFRDIFNDGTGGLAAPQQGALDEVNKALAEERRILADMKRDAAAKQVADDLKRAAEEAKRLKEQAEKTAEAVYYMIHPELRNRGATNIDVAKYLDQLDDKLHGIAAKDAASAAHDAAEQQKRDLDEILGRLREELSIMKDQEEQAKRNRDILLSAGGGILSAVLQRAGGGAGVIGNVGGAVIGAAATGNPYAMAAAGAQALVSSIFSLGDAEKEHERQLEATRRQLELFIDSEKEQLGLLTPLEGKVKALTRAYADQRDAIAGGKNVDELRGTIDAINDLETFANASQRRMLEKRKAELQEEIDQLSKLDPLYKAHLEDLNREIEFTHQMTDQDLRARGLRAAGLDEEADALELLTRQQKELDDARKSGYDATQLYILAEIQKTETLNVSIEKTKASVAALAKTISGLEDFRNALLLSPAAGLSPTDQLTEAQRQYSVIVGQARGGNQDAAGRIPGAANTLLEFARTVFGSGAAFQNIFQGVLGDTADLIDRFEGQKTIQEQILAELVRTREEELAKIRIYLEPLGEVLHGANGTINTVDQTSGLLQAQLDAQQAGFTQVVQGLDDVRDAIAALEAAQARSADGAAVNRTN